MGFAQLVKPSGSNDTPGNRRLAEQFKDSERLISTLKAISKQFPNKSKRHIELQEVASDIRMGKRYWFTQGHSVVTQSSRARLF